MVEREGFHVIGVGARTTNVVESDLEAGQIGRLWQRFFDENVGRRTPATVPGLIASVYFDYESDETGAYSVILGPVVTSTGTVPDGLRTVSVPPGRYLSFPVEGMPPTAIIDGWSRIHEWFARPRPVVRTFTFDAELYRPGVTEILVAVREASGEPVEESP
jgi:predicted transcriptional regulator YdeE